MYYVEHLLKDISTWFESQHAPPNLIGGAPLTVRITCVNKLSGYNSNPHEAISELGWIDEADNRSGRATRLEMYDFLKTGGGSAFVRDSYGNVAYLYPRENQYGTKYVQTHADGVWKDNLLAQPTCY